MIRDVYVVCNCVLDYTSFIIKILNILLQNGKVGRKSFNGHRRWSQVVGALNRSLIKSRTIVDGFYVMENIFNVIFCFN